MGAQRRVYDPGRGAGGVIAGFCGLVNAQPGLGGSVGVNRVEMEGCLERTAGAIVCALPGADQTRAYHGWWSRKREAGHGEPTGLRKEFGLHSVDLVGSRSVMSLVLS